MKIIDLAEEDRPREKMARIGAENLTNSELLAILIGSGSVNESAVGTRCFARSSPLWATR